MDQTPPRNQRKIRRGVVVSDKMQKTVVVEMSRQVQHPVYLKTVKRTSRLKAHDEIGCDVGDIVEVMETRPLSREKCWRVVRILVKVK